MNLTCVKTVTQPLLAEVIYQFLEDQNSGQITAYRAQNHTTIILLNVPTTEVKRTLERVHVFKKIYF